MGGVEPPQTSKRRGGLPGKIDAPLTELLGSVEWGEYRLGDLFEKVKVNTLKYKTKDLPSKPNEENPLPALTAGIQNQGLNNYVPKEGATILQNVISISANGANTGATFYQPHEFTVLQDAYAIEWKFTEEVLSSNAYLFITSSISRVIYGKYEWTNKAGWERIKDELIQLPTRGGEIDYEFMERFIAELNVQRLAELNAYLIITGLRDYELSEAERTCLARFERGETQWEEFQLAKVFYIKNAGNILGSDVVLGSGTTPYLCASRENNAVSGCISYKEELKNQGNCIFIGGKTFVLTYQEKDFYSNDSHNLIFQVKAEEHRTKIKQFYMLTCIEKGLSHKYSWGNSISYRKVQEDKVLFPIKGGEVDFAEMELLISAVQKLVIRDVVAYADRRIATTAEVIARPAPPL